MWANQGARIVPHEEPSAWSQHELAGELLRLATRSAKHVLAPVAAFRRSISQSCALEPQRTAVY